ncbi:MAG TPA: EamA family transporter [Jiangellaceae bacterium]|jgi:drug/metabolite transporter (DMT)-like permease
MGVAKEPAAEARVRSGEQVALAAFLGYSLLGGGNAVSIRFSNRELAPLWGAGLRFALGAVLLLAVMALLRLEFPRGRQLAGTLLYGALTFGGAFACAYYALVRIHAGFGQIILALVPLATLLLAVVWRQERFRAMALAGCLLSLGGIAVMSQAPLRESVPGAALLAALGSVVCFAQGALVVRRFPPVHPVTMNALGMAVGMALLLAGSALVGEHWTLPTLAETWLAVAYLVLIGSGVVFVLYTVVLRHWAASRAAYGFVLTPFVAVVLSALLDDEPVTVGLAIGGLLVLAGVYVGALRRA